MSESLCIHCGNVWLHFDQAVRYPKSGKCIPLDKNNQRHDFRDCPKSPFNLRRQSQTRATAVKKSDLKKIDDHAILSEIHDKVRYWNSRLANYVLDLHVDKKCPEGEEV